MLRVLGEVSADVGGQAVDLGHPKQRCVLAVLVVEAGRVVPVDRLVDRVWGADGPRRGRETLHSYLSRLRRALADVLGLAIVRRSGGYLLSTEAESVVDLHLFRGLCVRARGCDDDRAARLLTEALALWRGEALTGLDGDWAEAERDRLGRERLAALHDLVDVRLRLGQGAELVAELSARAREHPLDERVAGQFMTALCQVGRAADALDHFRDLRLRLVEDLGAEPGEALREVHRRVLAGDPVSTRRVEVSGVPRQLPAAPRAFVGRRGELDRLDAVLPDPALWTLAGAGGVGKTWLALHWSHRRLDRFPDGQLFADLHGFSPDGRAPDASGTLRGFLLALGLEPSRVPADADTRAALYRSMVAGRRMLVVLDNAATTDQVLPLLPGGSSCTVLVTSRRRLSGLITRQGARHLDLDVLSDADARELLLHRLGPARLAAEPDAVADLLAGCRGFPLALAIVAGRAHADPDLPLATLDAELSDHGVAALADEDPQANLPVVLAASHRALTDRQREVFALVGIAPGVDVTARAVAALAGLPDIEAVHVLRGLREGGFNRSTQHR